MNFEQKLKMVSNTFAGKCSSFIVIGENIILTNKCLNLVKQEKSKALENVEEYFGVTDDFAEHLAEEYREAFDVVIQIASSTFYIASVWEARIFITVSSVNGLRSYKWRWVSSRMNTLLCRLAWAKPLDPHEVAVKANNMFGVDLYRIYDVMPFFDYLRETDWNKEDVMELIANRYIAIDMLPIDVLKGIGRTIDECDLMQHDIVSLFDCKMELTEQRIRNLKVSDIANARILAMQTFEDEIRRLIGSEEDKAEAEIKMYSACSRPEED